MESAEMKPEGRRVFHVFNPCAGKAKAYQKALKSALDSGADVFGLEYRSTREAVCALLTEHPDAHLIVHGGDGTVFDTVNGIMESGCGSTASFSVSPTGSGNDFSAYMNSEAAFSEGISKTTPREIDLIRTVSDGVTRYFANMMNVGFDCSVVWETYSMKDNKVIKGKLAYISGVFKVLKKKETMSAKIRLEGCVDLATGAEAEEFECDKDILLTAVGNSKYCGGGFKALPNALVTDGLMDVLIIDDVTVPKFASLIVDYRAGTYISPEGVMKKRFREPFSCFRCRKMILERPERICLDGEIFSTGGDRRTEIEVVPKAVKYIAL
ncbi:MAG: hypothetical protein IJU57_02125 [Clostridia bacterium]|nr:hypothetical protein [Clostridia bacterium]